MNEYLTPNESPAVVDCADLFGDGSAETSTSKRNWGGKRAGAGRKPASYRPPPEKLELDEARARHEQIKAERAELALQTELKQWVSRDAYREASVRLIAAFAQSIRSIPDTLERDLGLAPAVIEAIGVHLDDALETLADEMQNLVNPQDDDPDA